MKKIVVIGPESTGKSSLCQALAEHYHTSWCPEYARKYLLKYGTDYTYEDLLVIAKGQIELENNSVQAAENSSAYGRPSLLPSEFLFIDTDMYVMKVWCEYVFGKCHSYILEQIAYRKYDAYLLCNTDLPWIKDELREYPDEKNRIELFEMYKDILINQSTPFTIVSGQGQERVDCAVQFLDNLPPSHFPDL